MKKLRLSSLVCLVFIVISVFILTASARAITCYPFRGDSGVQSFPVYPNSTTEVRFQPWKTGTWSFEAYHFNPFMYKYYVNVFTYWRDASNPSDPWHYFGGGGAACFYSFTPSKSVLYSGKSSISYKFVLVNHSDYSMTVKIKLTKK